MPRLSTLVAVAFAAALAAGPAAAQSGPVRTCGTPTPTAAEVLASVVQSEQWLAAHPALAAQQRGAVVTIPVAVHLITSGGSPAQGNVPDQWVIDQIEGMNDAYANMGLRFVLAFQQRVENADWANLSQGGADEIAMKQALHLDVSRYLNAYFAPSITSPQGALLGFATFPDANAETNFRQGVVNVTNSLPGAGGAPYDEGDTATHEVGHWAGLFHTFQGGCAGGDGVNDTPAEATPNFTGCPLTRDTCPADPGFDPVTNFMDYSVDACLTEFTPGQRTRSLALMNLFRPTIMTQSGVLAPVTALTFEEAYVGVSQAQTIRLVNLSATDVDVTSVTSSSPAFVGAPSAQTIPAGGAVEIEVTFVPLDGGPVTGTLTVATNDPATPTVAITVAGAGRQAAAVSFSSIGFLAEAAPGATATRTLTLSNGGPAVLAYTFGSSARAAAPAVGVESPARVGGGGPDAFGYVWNDSNELGGPAYAWVDISATGTAVTLPNEGRATVALPFPFPFYGTDRTSVDIVSNGWLGFAGSGTAAASFNTTLPSPAPPNDLLAVFWDNLNPALGGEVRYQDMGDGRFVVSFLAVPLASGPGTLTFQAILYANGRVRYQYQSLTANTAAATIGIENADGSTGLQVVANGLYATDNLAIEFKAIPDWLSLAPESGEVAVGATEDVTLTFDASGLDAGAYQELVSLTTNDPTIPQPTRLHVVFAVGGLLPPPALVSPLYGDADVEQAAVLAWIAAPGATGYEWQVATDASFAATVATGTSASSNTLVQLDLGTDYFWRVRSTDGVAPSAWSLPFAFTTQMTVAAGDAADRSAFALGSLYPNPTRGRLSVPFSLAAADDAVTVRVLDVTGREVALLARGATYGAGAHRLEWDASGLPAGVYLVQLQAGGAVETARVTVLR